jgi:hypothetical protein
MAEFILLPTLHIGDRCLWRTHGDLVYWSDIVPEPIVVPDDFETDLASIPRWVPEYFIPRNGVHRAAAIVHDYLCRFHGFDRVTADRIFLEAMQVAGESRWRRYAMYTAVRLKTGLLKMRGKA